MIYVRLLLLLAGISAAVIGSLPKGLSSEASSGAVGGVKRGASTPPRDPPSPSLTINSITVSPTLDYRGESGAAGGWPGVTGPTLALAGSGTDPTYQVTTTAVPPVVRGVTFAAGKSFNVSDTTANLTGTQDLALELVLDVGSNTGTLFGNKNNTSTASGTGRLAHKTAATTIRFLFAAFSIPSMSATVPATGNYCHVMVFVDRNEASANGGAIYVNGVSAATGNFSILNGTAITSATSVLAMGALPDATGPSNATIVVARMWEQATWHPGGASNPTAWAAVAAARYAQYLVP